LIKYSRATVLYLTLNSFPVIRKNIVIIIGLLVFIVAISSCDKVNVTLDDTSGTDPNITYFENYKTEIATYKPDSFATSYHEVFSVGSHVDPVFGKVTANSYAQVELPLSNKVLDQSVTFDSLELVLRSNGQFYGDSSLPISLQVYHLSQLIQNTITGDTYYNNDSFTHDPVPIGQQRLSLYGRTGELLHIRLSDNLGQELLDKFKAGSDEISTQDNFSNYFKGIFITSDNSVTNSVAYFNSGTDSALLRLHYHQNVVFSTPDYMDMNYTKARQFNHVSFDHTGTIFSTVINNTTQLIPSTDTYGQSFLNSNLGTYIKISFPTLLNLKELHPYIQVVKAELIIKPDIKSFTAPYQLPNALYLLTTDNTNVPVDAITDPVTESIEWGNLNIDHLYAENTSYSFDITKFINTKIGEGQFSTSALLLTNSLSGNTAGIQRLITNDQSNNKGIQLKLYVLGL